MVEILTLTGTVVGLLKDIGVLDKVKDKLIKRSGDPAFNEISEVLTKIYHFYYNMNDELSILTKLSVANEEDKTQTEEILQIRVKGGALYDKLRQVRLKCGEISTIWSFGFPDKNIPPLEKWFESLKKDRTISKKEHKKIEFLFHDLYNGDGDLVRLVDNISYYAEEKADKILPLLESNNIQGAGIEIEKMKTDINEFRKQLSKSSGQLQRMGYEFTSKKGQYIPIKMSFWQKVSSVFSRSKRS